MKTLEYLQSKGYLMRYSKNVTNIRSAKIDYSSRGYHYITFKYDYDGSLEEAPFNLTAKNKEGGVEFKNKQKAIKFISTINN